MAPENVKVPMSVLLDTRITAADKLVWMLMRLDNMMFHGRKLASPTRLTQRTHLSRFTIYNSLDRLTVAGWYNGIGPICTHTNSGILVNMPAALLISKNLEPRDKVVYGLLQDKPFYEPTNGKLTYLALSKNSKLCVKTVRQAVKALVKAGWIDMQQDNRLTPIHFQLADPREAQRQEIEKRINASPFRGEAIGREMVMFLVKQTNYQVHSEPDWLINPKTRAFMEVDLNIPEYELVMEYQGAQHFRETEFSSAEEVAKQQARDAIKAQIFKEKHKKALWLQAEDLSLDIITKKLKDLKVPLRELGYLKPIASYLDKVGRKYRHKVKLFQAQQKVQDLAKALVGEWEERPAQSE